jgi:hypothetical protein
MASLEGCTARAPRPHPSRAASRPPQDDGKRASFLVLAAHFCLRQSYANHDRRVGEGAKRRAHAVYSIDAHRVGFASLSTTLRSATTKKEAERRQAHLSYRPHQRMSARVQRDALACRRSTTALAVGAFAPWAQLQARLPGTWRERIVLSSYSPQPGGERLRAAKRALPAPACPSPGNARPGPVVMPVR